MRHPHPTQSCSLVGVQLSDTSYTALVEQGSSFDKLQTGFQQFATQLERHRHSVWNHLSMHKLREWLVWSYKSSLPGQRFVCSLNKMCSIPRQNIGWPSTGSCRPFVDVHVYSLEAGLPLPLSPYDMPHTYPLRTLDSFGHSSHIPQTTLF